PRTPARGCTRRRDSCARLRRSSACCSFSPPFLFGGGLVRGQRVLPEAVEVRAQVGERLLLDAVDPARAFSPLGHQPRLLQDAEVLGDGGAGDGERGGATDDQTGGA